MPYRITRFRIASYTLQIAALRCWSGRRANPAPVPRSKLAPSETRPRLAAPRLQRHFILCVTWVRESRSAAYSSELAWYQNSDAAAAIY